MMSASLPGHPQERDMQSTAVSLSPRTALVRTLQSAGVLALLIACASCDKNNPAGPSTGFSIVLEKVGFGVIANPSQNTNYAAGASVSYAFTAQDGVSGVYLTIDGVQAPSSGTVTMDKGHTFNAVINNQVGFRAPSFSGMNAIGGIVRLSDYLGKIVFVDFAEPTCAGSPPQAAALKTHYNNYHSKGLEILTVLVNCPGLNNCPANSPSSSARLSSWTTTYGLPYPVISDPSGVTNIFNWSIPDRTTDFPTSYIVNASGNIIYRFRGFDQPTTSNAISAALALLFQ
jgi:peroxiredoxin